MPLRARVFAALADGHIHPAHRVAARLGVSPRAVRAELVSLGELGVDIESCRGRGYRVRTPWEPLHAEAVSRALSADTRSHIEWLDVRFDVDSTNRVLLQCGAPPASRVRGCAAEFQHAGRGRHGRRWQSPPGTSLCLSLGWSHAGARVDLNGLSLAHGRPGGPPRRARGGPRIRLKWPKDRAVDGAKRGGILGATAGHEGALGVVAGIGINVTSAPAVEQPSVALGAAAGTLRSRLCAALIDGWVQAFEVFRAHGLAPFRGDWEALDLARGREVTVSSGTGEVHGVAAGVDVDGALLVDSADGTQAVYAGEVSLRVVA